MSEAWIFRKDDSDTLKLFLTGKTDTEKNKIYFNM